MLDKCLWNDLFLVLFQSILLIYCLCITLGSHLILLDFTLLLIEHFFHLLKKGIRNAYCTSTPVNFQGQDMVTALRENKAYRNGHIVFTYVSSLYVWALPSFFLLIPQTMNNRVLRSISFSPGQVKGDPVW